MEKVRPKVGMGVYIINPEGKVLMMLRKGATETGGGTWCPPGGHLEMEESFKDCAIREVKEEVDLNVQDIEILGVVNNVFSNVRHYVNVDVLAKGVTGEFKNNEPEKCEKIEWFSLNELPSPLLLPVENLFKNYPELKSKLSKFNSFTASS